MGDSIAIAGRLQTTLLKQASLHLEEGFPGYQPQREIILKAFEELLQTENIEAVLQPRRFLDEARPSAMVSRIKEKGVTPEELREYGVVPAHAPVAENVTLLASLYVLPASPAAAKRATLKPQEYKNLKPHVTESFFCKPDKTNTGYFIRMGAWGIEGAMALEVNDPDPTFGHFHLADRCRAGQTVFQTENVLHFDGMKIYWPVAVEENGRPVQKTVVLSASIAVLSGAIAFCVNHFSSPESKAHTYGLGGLGEIWMVISNRSQKQNPKAER